MKLFAILSKSAPHDQQYYVGDPPPTPPYVTIPPPPVVPPVKTTFDFDHLQEGWRCPNCKRGIAPFMPYCPFCANTPRVETRGDTQL